MHVLHSVLIISRWHIFVYECLSLHNYSKWGCGVCCVSIFLSWAGLSSPWPLSFPHWAAASILRVWPLFVGARHPWLQCGPWGRKTHPLLIVSAPVSTNTPSPELLLLGLTHINLTVCIINDLSPLKPCSTIQDSEGNIYGKWTVPLAASKSTPCFRHICPAVCLAPSGPIQPPLQLLKA